MNDLKASLSSLPTLLVGETLYLSVQAVTDAVAAFLFPTRSPDQINGEMYQHILETAAILCHELGYGRQERLTPPTVSLAESGLYWVKEPEDPEFVLITGPGWVEEMQEGRLVDIRLGHLAEITQQHFTIPVTALEAVYDLMKRAVENPHWHNDFGGIWHDILTMASLSRQNLSPTERAFSVIIRGVGPRTLWPMKLLLCHDSTGNPYLVVELIDEKPPPSQLFPLGQVVMTEGVAELGIDIFPYLARHARGDWGETLDEFDKRQNEKAVKAGLRILSAYDVPLADGTTERIWLITEADRSVTTALLPTEY